jgi:hypothetical protein
MLDALLHRLHGAVHHRRGGPEAGALRVAHDVEPLIRAGLAVAVQNPAHPIDQNLGPAAGDAVESGGDQTLDHARHRQL